MPAKKGLSRDAELSLYTRIQAGDNDAQHELVAAHMNYGVQVALRLAAGSFPHDEIQSAAVAGLYESLRTWDARKGKFTTHLIYAVRRKVYELWSSQIGVKISCKSYNRLKKEGGSIVRIPFDSPLHGRDPSADRAIPHFDDYGSDVGIPGFASLSEGLTPDEQDRFTDPDDARGSIDRTEMHERLTTALEKLRPRELRVIVGKYFEDRTLVEIGRTWTPKPVSGEWMRVVHGMALNRLRKLLKE